MILQAKPKEGFDNTFLSLAGPGPAMRGSQKPAQDEPRTRQRAGRREGLSGEAGAGLGWAGYGADKKVAG